MPAEVQVELVRLSQTIGATELQVLRAFSNNEVLEELASRGATRKDMQDLAEALTRVKAAFYNNPQPT